MVRKDDYINKLLKYKDKSIIKILTFVTKKGKLIKYYQVCYIMESEKTRNREFGVYESIIDNFEKYVLSMDNYNYLARCLYASVLWSDCNNSNNSMGLFYLEKEILHINHNRIIRSF
ncbi:MAG: hypothetical protein WCY80_03645 [Candidatus Izemoplasmatales bacterium]